MPQNFHIDPMWTVTTANTSYVYNTPTQEPPSFEDQMRQAKSIQDALVREHGWQQKTIDVKNRPPENQDRFPGESDDVVWLRRRVEEITNLAFAA